MSRTRGYGAHFIHMQAAVLINAVQSRMSRRIPSNNGVECDACRCPSAVTSMEVGPCAMGCPSQGKLPDCFMAEDRSMVKIQKAIGVVCPLAVTLVKMTGIAALLALRIDVGIHTDLAVCQFQIRALTLHLMEVFWASHGIIGIALMAQDRPMIRRNETDDIVRPGGCWVAKVCDDDTHTAMATMMSVTRQPT